MTGAAADPTLMPSISTRVWSGFAPRSDTNVSLPAPPALENVTPGSPRSASGTERIWRRSICSRSTTLTEARVFSSGSGVRVAVTTTGSKSVVASAKDWPQTATASIAGNGAYFMSFSSKQTYG